jgi:potassium/chloride transporter 9
LTTTLLELAPIMSEQTDRPPPPNRRNTHRAKSNFLARTAADDAAQLHRRSSVMPEVDGPQDPPNIPSELAPLNPYEPADENSEPEPRKYYFTHRVFQGFGDRIGGLYRRRSKEAQSKSHQGGAVLADHSSTAQIHARTAYNGKMEENKGPKKGSLPRPVGGFEKLGTFSGVFVPTSLNVLSILMFLRFGFILGQGGFLGMMGMLIASYLINLITTLSISAIASNGTVRGGGAYYLISRSLGPEFGGSIGVVFYLGFVFNTGMNAVGLIDCFRQNFGQQSGNWYNWLPEAGWWAYLWATVVLLTCTGICLAGSSIFARASNGLLAILLLATFSIPISALILKPFSRMGIEYTGISATTFIGNLKPRFTRNAAGSQIHGKENFQDLFGILFPATGGIFA